MLAWFNSTQPTYYLSQFVVPLVAHKIADKLFLLYFVWVVIERCGCVAGAGQMSVVAAGFVEHRVD